MPLLASFVLAAALGITAPPPCAVALQPLGPQRDIDLPDLASGLRSVFGCSVSVVAPKPLPASAFYPARNRYRADRLLPFLSTIAAPGVKVLGITAADISVTKDSHPDWGVFGFATLGGTPAVISTFRLARHASVQHPPHLRALKVAVHELGHTFGLPHCPSVACVMRAYNGLIVSLDAAPLAFCRTCRTRIAPALRAGGLTPACSGLATLAADARR